MYTRRGTTMSAIRRILVAIKDLDGKHLPALLKAAQLARAYGAQLELVHGLTAPLYTDGIVLRQQGLGALELDVRQEALRRLEAAADRLRIHSIKVSVCAEWDYPSHEAIIRRARAIKADLIVASLQPGRHRLPWLLRLTDWELVRLSPMPVLLVKNSHPYRHPAVLAAIDPGHSHAKPLKLDRTIMKVSKTLSKALRGTLNAVHAYARFPMGSYPEGMSAQAVQGLAEEAEHQAELRFQRAIKPMRIARARQFLIARQPIDAIEEAARKSKSAIVVMGAISRSGYRRLLIGNTAERILDELSCDILVVKPVDFANKVPQSSRGARLRVGIPTGALGYTFGRY
jgi:universal stress protein E